MEEQARRSEGQITALKQSDADAREEVSKSESRAAKLAEALKRSIAESEDKLHVLDDKIAKLMANIRQLDDKLRALQSEKADKEDIITGIESQLRTSNSKALTIRSELAARIEQLETETLAKDSQISEAKVALVQARRESEALRGDASAAIMDSKAAQESLTSLQRQLKVREVACTEIKYELASAERRAEDEAQRATEEKAKSQRQSEALAKATAQLGEEQERHSALRQELEAQVAMLKREAKSRKDAELALKSQTSKVADLEARLSNEAAVGGSTIAARDSSLEAATKRIATLELDVRTVTAELRSKEGKLTEAKVTMSEMEHDIRERSAKVQQVQTALELKTSQLAALTKEVEGASESARLDEPMKVDYLRLKSIVAEFTSTSEGHHVGTTLSKIVADTVRSAQAKAGENQMALQDARRQLEHLRASESELAEKARTAARADVASQQEINDLKRQIARLQLSESNLDADFKQQEEGQSALRKQVTQLTVDLSSVTADRDDLLDEHQRLVAQVDGIYRSKKLLFSNSLPTAETVSVLGVVQATFAELESATAASASLRHSSDTEVSRLSQDMALLKEELKAIVSEKLLSDEEAARTREALLAARRSIATQKTSIRSMVDAVTSLKVSCDRHGADPTTLNSVPRLDDMDDDQLAASTRGLLTEIDKRIAEMASAASHRTHMSKDSIEALSALVNSSELNVLPFFPSLEPTPEIYELIGNDLQAMRQLLAEALTTLATVLDCDVSHEASVGDLKMMATEVSQLSVRLSDRATAMASAANVITVSISGESPFDPAKSPSILAGEATSLADEVREATQEYEGLLMRLAELAARFGGQPAVIASRFGKEAKPSVVTLVPLPSEAGVGGGDLNIIASRCGSILSATQKAFNILGSQHVAAVSDWQALNDRATRLEMERVTAEQAHEEEIEKVRQVVGSMREALRKKIEDDREAETRIRQLEAVLDEQASAAQEQDIDREVLMHRITEMRRVLRASHSTRQPQTGAGR
eukprot:GILJ01016656.1.p1 GENE.GILJ01016656.1~~GILJ01016656.1.p1  ORF type:complete len:1127 (-),score=221.74 GILJ01016656.1:58-3063(-)